jgi:hypothetical protein
MFDVIMRHMPTSGSSYVATGLNARKTPLLAVKMSKRLMLSGETVAVYSENHMEHTTNTLCVCVCVCVCVRERERESEKMGDSERHYILGRGQETISPVPRQCPLVLLV